MLLNKVLSIGSSVLSWHDHLMSTRFCRLMEIANKYANGEEEIRQKNQQHRGGGGSVPNSKPKSAGNNKRRTDDAPTDAELVAAANASGIQNKTQQKREWQPRQKKPPSGDDILD